MQQYLIAIDLDGTTLNNQSELTPYTIEILRRVSELGHLVVITTGRPFRNSHQYYEALGIESPIINLNGAYAHFPNKPNWAATYEAEVPLDAALKLLEHKEELGVSLICAEGPGYVFASSYALPDSPFFVIDPAEITVMTKESLTFGPTSLSVFSSVEDQARIKATILQHYGDQIDVDIWGGSLPFLEVVQKGVNKAYGLKHLAEFYHIPTSHIMAFGDQHNDLTMIAYAGHGVAMENAIEPLKAIAQDVTEFSNDEDGLAKYLAKFFNLEPTT